MKSTKQVGDAGESRAVRYLRKKKFTIVALNYRTRFGEIDIIAEKGGVVVFVEVKHRRGETRGKGFESVSSTKQSRLAASANQWMAECGREVACRFDVISIDDSEVTHIENAFGT